MTILKEVLDAVLTKEQREAGIYLEQDEDFLYLFERREIFNATKATYQKIRARADKIIEQQKAQNPYPKILVDETSDVEVPDLRHQLWQEGYEAGRGKRE